MKPNPCKRCRTEPISGEYGYDFPQKRMTYFVQCERCGKALRNDGTDANSLSSHKRRKYVIGLWNFANPLPEE